ncbi:unnamed protein product [Candida verbasci]|uniref:Uncharacterized protein n=1 Tax=Candida verbasci TaxID=1227364 RepID=A0A9W4XK39_9ASCO|nr:unnamed protein product [Candida verbasci]
MFLLFTFITLTLAASNRQLFFNYQNNAACILINEPTPFTQLSFNFQLGSNQSIPLVIFNYLDIVNFKNLPNFDQFLNHTYLDVNKFITKDVEFNFQTFKSKSLPEHFESTIIQESGEYNYQIFQNGTYCIYLPLYTFDETIIHPTHYYATMKIEHEFRHVDLYHKFSTNLTITILFASTLLLLSYFNPSIREFQIEKLTIVKQQLVTLLFGTFAFYFLYTINEFLTLFAIPSDKFYSLSEGTFGHAQYLIIDKWQKYTISKIYFGVAFKNFTKPRIFDLIFAINVISSFVSDYLIKIDSTDILVNDKPFQILKQSILVPGFYKSVLQNVETDGNKLTLEVASALQLISGILIQLITLIVGIKVYWKLKDRKLQAPILQSLLLHLITWSTFVKHLIYHLYIKISIRGIFDVGELLGVIGSLIETYQVKVVSLNLVEILLLWFIWTRDYTE